MLGSGTQGVWEISGRGGMTVEWIDRMEVKEERGEREGGEIDLASQEMTADEGLS